MIFIVLSCLAIGWCALHSLLISSRGTDALLARWPGIGRFYRLLYNGAAVLTLAPLIVAAHLADGPVVFGWRGGWNILRAVMLAAAVLLFHGGAKEYDLKSFLGLRQLETGERTMLLSDAPEFVARGVFALVRHPWYLGGLLFIWAAPAVYRLANFLVAVILSTYLLVGALLEERRILSRHRQAYGVYREQVSMLFPWKWLVKKLRRTASDRLKE